MRAVRALCSPAGWRGGFCGGSAVKGMTLVMITEVSQNMLEGIRTRFVRERLAETTFASRGSVGGLIFWESIAAQGGPHGFASATFYHPFEQRYPVECRCVWTELKDGSYTDPEAYRALLQEHAVEDRRQKEALAREREAQHGALRDVWIRAGGRS